MEDETALEISMDVAPIDPCCEESQVAREEVTPTFCTEHTPASMEEEQPEALPHVEDTPPSEEIILTIEELQQTTKPADNEENVIESNQSIEFSPMSIDLSQPEILLCKASQNFNQAPENFLKGCKWSPDGSCLLTCSEDNYLRLFNTPYELYENCYTGIADMTAVLKMKEGETVYDYAWYPGMSSLDPDTCFFVSVCRDHPVHMWDAHSGQLRASYRPYNHLDELATPYSVAFSPNGKRLLCGFYKMIRVFDVSRPGRECQSRKTYDKQGQGGIISCIAVNPADQSLYAAGSYNRSIAIYAEPRGEMICLLQGQTGGVTHLAFSPDGNKLYSGGRKDSEILCWDVRQPGEVLFSMQRSVRTNQRIYFDQDLSGKHLVSGNHDGTVAVWNTAKEGLEADALLDPEHTFQAHSDCVNGVSLNPVMPLLATSSGQRHPKYPSMGGDSSSSEDAPENEKATENSVKLWWLGPQRKNQEETG